jgi:hypothetical protein
MKNLNRITAVTATAVALTFAGVGVASAVTGSYSATATESSASFAVSQATFYAQNQGYAAGFRVGQCPVGSQSVRPYGPNYMAIVYVTCYRSS